MWHPNNIFDVHYVTDSLQIFELRIKTILIYYTKEKWKHYMEITLNAYFKIKHEYF